MRYWLVLLSLMLAVLPVALAGDIDLKVVADSLSKGIDRTLPIILDIQAGDMTTELETLLKQRLLAHGADIRELDYSGFAEADTVQNEAEPEQFSFLSKAGLEHANLVRIGVDLQWKTKERSRLFTYHRVRYPGYTFSIRNITIPEYRLIAVSDYRFDGKPEPKSATDDVRLKWYDPIVAATAVGTLIYLLWNIE